MSRVLTDSFTHVYAKCENRHLCSINDNFFKIKAFCFISQNPLDKLRYSLVFTKFRVFLWVANFQGLTVGFACLLTLSNFHHWIHMSNQEYRVFHSSGYLSLVGIPNTRIFLLCDCETYFGRCLISPSPPSNTKHSVNLYHALIPMSCDVSCINTMQCHCMYLMLHV